ncbi:MAG: hypothetical protein HGB37_00685 [Candidatus Moranbacteria bacterium]|nr:hypothetical protein [Candidatus Moranbacteria bacterium]
MSDLKEMFAKREGQEEHADITPEEYKHIHVMQDDLDELSGKNTEKPVERNTEETSIAAGGNPFLGDVSGAGAVSPQELGGPSETNAKTKLRSLKIDRKILIVSGVIVLVILIVAAVFVIVGRSAPPQDVPTGEDLSSKAAVTPTVSESLSTPVDTTEKPFVETGANYLQLNTDSTDTTTDDIVSILDETASKMSVMDTSVPVEFLVRDMNNNPIAFSRFAYLLGLKLPEELLANVNESFSLYFVREPIGVRRALVIQVKDAEKLSATIVKSESSLPASFSALLYGKGVVVSSAQSFRDGSFGTMHTRFSIVSAEAGLSFDHVVLEKRWIIGTSKDSFGSVLGGVLQKISK